MLMMSVMMVVMMMVMWLVLVMLRVLNAFAHVADGTGGLGRGNSNAGIGGALSRRSCWAR